MTDGAGEWRAAREADIRKAYADKHRWTDLDTVTSQHDYSFESIENWPLDAALIYKPTDRASVLLGSMKAACGSEDIWKTLSLKVTVVVTMCAHEMKMQGAPKDWTSYFKQHGVFHINCHLEDVTLKTVQRWSERIPALVESCLEQWKMVCGSLWKQSMEAVTNGESMHVLFHCFGGLQLFCPGCHPVAAGEATFLATLAQSPLYVLVALWKLDGLRVEWQRDLSGADGN